MTERLYFPTRGELIDRLSIVLLKSIRIPENLDSYRHEMALIMHDIDLFSLPMSAKELYAVLVLMAVNMEIWNNESEARKGGRGQDERLRFTHAINGIRAQAKNILSERSGERIDLKKDCYAADLPEEFGNWRVF